MTGELNLKVTKDRPGHVRANCQKRQRLLVEFLIKSTAEGAVTMVIEAPELIIIVDQLESWRLFQSLSKKNQCQRTPSRRQLKVQMSTVRAALDCLVKEGFATFSECSQCKRVHIGQDDGNARFRLVKPSKLLSINVDLA
jgi:hypothetical protein